MDLAAICVAPLHSVLEYNVAWLDITPLLPICLGVVLDPQLTFDDHVLKTTSSCMSSLAQISRVKHVLDRNQLVTVINALIFSKLLSYSTVWSNTSNKNICRLQSLFMELLTFRSQVFAQFKYF